MRRSIGPAGELDRYRARVILAELEVFHSRPIAPTRRVALGVTVLPTAPPPGFGGLLLGGIVAAFVGPIDPDLHGDLVRLTHQLEQGQRIPQPRLRHRFQADRVGSEPLLPPTHRRRRGARVRARPQGRAARPQVLAAVYAAGRARSTVRPAGCSTRSAGRPGGVARSTTSLLDYLSGHTDTSGWSTVGGTDPVHWALGVLGFAPVDAARPKGRPAPLPRAAARRPSRPRCRPPTVLPQRIAELAEARRILLAG